MYFKKYIDNELEIRKNELIIIIHVLRHLHTTHTRT